jgi:putative hemolysin
MVNLARARVVIVLLLLLAVISPASALANPAAVYCTALNYTYTSVNGTGGMTGYCTMPDNQKVEAWRFLQGKEEAQYSYCSQQGYPLEVTTDAKICRVFMTDSCAVCVLPGGSKTEVTKLMGLDFREMICSNGKCCDPATDTTCSFADNKDTGSPYLIPAVVILVIAAGTVLFLWMRKKVQPPEKKE